MSALHSLVARGLVLALTCVPAARAQSNLIPPPANDEVRAEREREAAKQTVQNAILNTPEISMQRGALDLHATGQPGAVPLLGDAGKVGKVIRRAAGGARLADAVTEGGRQGFYSEGTQMVIERGFDEALDWGLSKASNFAVKRLGATAVGASGGLSLSLSAGQLVGGYFRDSPDVGEVFGLSGTLGDEVDEFWFQVAPDWTKELASGVKQVDTESAEWQARTRADIERNKRRAVFERVAADNREQERQRQAYQAAQAAEAAAVMSAAAPAPPLNWPPALFTPHLAQPVGLPNFNLPMPTPPFIRKPIAGGGAAPLSCRPARTLDPKTGCHIGHDERSHPGGCKCG